MDRKPLSAKTDLVQDVDGLYVVTTQPLGGLLDQNAYKRNHAPVPKTWRHVAEIPNNLFWELVRKFGKPKENQRAWKAWFNDSDNAAFRTWHGRV